MNDHLQAIVAQGVFQHFISCRVVTDVRHQGLCRRHQFTCKFIHCNRVFSGKQEQWSLKVEHREHHCVQEDVSHRISGLVNPRTEIALQAFKGVFERTVNHPLHIHRTAIVGRLRHRQRRIGHGVRTGQGVVCWEIRPHGRFHVDTIVHRIANAVPIHISHQTCAPAIKAVFCVRAGPIVDICGRVKIARRQVDAALCHALTGTVIVNGRRVIVRGQIIGATAGVVGGIGCARPLDLNRAQLRTRGGSSDQHLGLELNEHIASCRQLPQPNSAFAIR